MNETQSPFRIERHLTPDLFDHYVAKARAERAKAISAFFGDAAAWLSGLAGRIHGRAIVPNSRSMTSKP